MVVVDGGYDGGGPGGVCEAATGRQAVAGVCGGGGGSDDGAQGEGGLCAG